jgi:hypothetical protein
MINLRSGAELYFGILSSASISSGLSASGCCMISVVEDTLTERQLRLQGAS